MTKPVSISLCVFSPVDILPVKIFLGYLSMFLLLLFLNRMDILYTWAACDLVEILVYLKAFVAACSQTVNESNKTRTALLLLTLVAPLKRFGHVRNQMPWIPRSHSSTVWWRGVRLFTIMRKIHLYKDQRAAILERRASIVTQAEEAICKLIASSSDRQIYACSQWRIRSTSQRGHWVVAIPWRSP